MKIIIKIFFAITLVLLPICSVRVLPSVFFRWSVNLSILPFIVLTIITLFLLILRRIKITKDNSYILMRLIYVYIIFTIINSLFMGLVMINFGNPLYRQLLEHKLISDIVLDIIIPVLFLSIMVINVKKFSIKSTIKTVIIGMFICSIIYGYIQIIAVNIRNGIIYDVYNFISNKIDYIWGSEGIYQYAFDTWRLNLTTPEASEAGAIICILFLPFLLSTILTGFSVFKSKFLGLINYETVFTILLIPIILGIGSSSLYVIVGIQVLVVVFLKLKKDKNYYKKIMSTIVILVMGFMIVNLILKSNPNLYYKIIYYIEKLSDFNEVSTSSRLGLMFAGIKSIVYFIVNGTGFSSTNVLIIENLPYWSINTEISEHLFSNQAWFVGVRNIRIILGCGLIGIYFVAKVFMKIYNNLKINKKYNNFREYLFYAFIIYFIGGFMQGFNSSTFSFMYLWVVLSIFIVSCNKEIVLDDIKK